MTNLTIIKSIILVSFAAVIALPMYIFLILEPSFESFITKNTEKEAISVGTHMSNLFFSGKKTITKANLPEDLKEQIARLQDEFHIIKVKVFNPSGEIVFSTSFDDIGEINTNPYFHEKIAKGQVFTKVVQKNQKTLEGQTLSVALVETYVPIMRNYSFAGAFEIYYDITKSKAQLDTLLLRIKQTSGGISACLFIALIVIFLQACRSVKNRKKSEEELLKAHNELEARVIERTQELKEVNKSLQKEIVVRKTAEAEKEALIQELQSTIEQVKTLRGLLPICSSCQQIRDSQGKWNKIDSYIQEHTEVELTHGICPTCAKNLYPELYDELIDEL